MQNLMAFIATIFILWSLQMIYSVFTPIQFWDQWQMVNYMAEGGKVTLSYLFAPHNEHIIATSKILYAIDYYLFDYANVFLIFSIILLHLAVAYISSWILFGAAISRNKIVHFLIAASMMLSLGQWENLVIGFQTQFGLTALFALLACYYGTLTANRDEAVNRNSLYTVIYTSLTIFSMGNGVALIFSFIAIIFMSRYSVRSISTLIVAYSVPAFVYFLERNSAIKDADIVRPGLIETARYFFSVLGATFTTNHSLAVVSGVGVALCFGFVFAFTVLLPMIRGEAIDRRVAAFTAVSIFSFGSSAAVAVGRASLGIDSSFTSRYATPNFLLYVALISTCCAHYMAKPRRNKTNHKFLVVFSLIGLGIAAATTFKSSTLAQMTARSEQLSEVGYFIKSGSRAANVLEKVFPVPNIIIPSISFLEKNELNIFSKRYGLSAPPTTGYQELNQFKSCGKIDYSLSRIDGNTWNLVGKIDQNYFKSRPAWVVTVDPQGLYHGYAPVVMTSGKRLRYSLPIQLKGVEPKPVVNIAILDEQEVICKFDEAVTLPKFKFEEGVRPSSAAAYYQLSTEPANLSQKLPTPIESIDNGVRRIFSTWQGDDAATGRIVYQRSSGAQACEETLVGVMRGPNEDGILLEITGDDGTVEQIPLRQVSAHEWHWLNIVGAGERCDAPKIQRIELVDRGHGWGAWGALSLPPLRSD